MSGVWCRVYVVGCRVQGVRWWVFVVGCGVQGVGRVADDGQGVPRPRTTCSDERRPCPLAPHPSPGSTTSNNLEQVALPATQLPTSANPEVFTPNTVDLTARAGLVLNLDTKPFTLHTTHYTTYTSHYTLHTTHYTLHTTHYTLHTTHHTPHTTHHTPHTTHYTLHTTHHTHHTPHQAAEPEMNKQGTRRSW